MALKNFKEFIKINEGEDMDALYEQGAEIIGRGASLLQIMNYNKETDREDWEHYNNMDPEDMIEELEKLGDPRAQKIISDLKEMKDTESKVNEGQAWKANTTKDDDVKIDTMKYKLEDYVKSLSCEIEEVGNDFEVHLEGDHIIQVMMRPKFIGIKKIGDKFPKEFKYNELGKVKSELSSIIKSHE